jgi:xanthine dehydrogenase accessory factor
MTESGCGDRGEGLTTSEAGLLVQVGDARELLDVEPCRAVVEGRQSGVPVALVTVIAASGSAPRGVGSSMAVRSDGTTVGTVGGGNLELYVIRHALESLVDGRTRRIHYDFTGGQAANVEKACCGTTDFLVQPFVPACRLVIFGAGHVGRALAVLGRSCGFDLAVVDDRSEFLKPEDFPAGTRLLQGPFQQLASTVPMDDRTYIVIMTYGHEQDERVLAACLRRSWRYLGMMGSRSKVATVRQHLTVTEEDRSLLNRVHAPIGLDTGGRSPGEIAVSIMGEILSVRYGRQGASLTQGNRP